MEKDIQEQVEEFESYPTPPSLDYMSSWLRQALTIAEQRGVERERERLEKELEIADERWKRAEQHHREEHQSDTEICIK